MPLKRVSTSNFTDFFFFFYKYLKYLSCLLFLRSLHTGNRCANFSVEQEIISIVNSYHLYDINVVFTGDIIHHRHCRSVKMTVMVIA